MLDNNYTIHVDDETKMLIEKLASIYQRKPSELLRILLIPQLCDLWAEVQRREHPENTRPFQTLNH